MLINVKKKTKHHTKKKTQLQNLLVPDGQNHCLKKYFCYQFKCLGVQNYTGRLSRTKPNKMGFTYKEKSKMQREGKYVAVNNNILQSLQLCELATETTSTTCF